MHARGAIEQDLIVQQDASFIRPYKSGNAIERQRLAGAARSEKHRDSFFGLEFYIQRKTGRLGTGWEVLADPRPDHIAVCRGPKGLVVSRLARLNTSNATAERITTSTRATVPLPASTAS